MASQTRNVATGSVSHRQGRRRFVRRALARSKDQPAPLLDPRPGGVGARGSSRRSGLPAHRGKSYRTAVRRAAAAGLSWVPTRFVWAATRRPGRGSRSRPSRWSRRALRSRSRTWSKRRRRDAPRLHHEVAGLGAEGALGIASFGSLVCPGLCSSGPAPHEDRCSPELRKRAPTVARRKRNGPLSDPRHQRSSGRSAPKSFNQVRAPPSLPNSSTGSSSACSPPPSACSSRRLDRS